MIFYWKKILKYNNIHLLHTGEGIWYSWVNKFSYFLYPPAINVLSYRKKPRKHIYVKYYWETYFKSIRMLSQIFKNHIVTVACKWCVPSASDVFMSKNWRENPRGFRGGGILFFSCVITCSDCHPLSSQINLLMVINIWSIII